MKRNVSWFLAGLVLVGFLSGCATAYYPAESAAFSANRSLGGKLATEYKPSDELSYLGSNFYQNRGSYTTAPVYTVNQTDPNVSQTYYHGASPIVSTKLDETEMAMRNAKVSGSRVVMAGRPVMGRRAMRQMNPYAGVDPYANNPYAGNTVTRGPRDFLMSNPPNIGP